MTTKLSELDRSNQLPEKRQLKKFHVFDKCVLAEAPMDNPRKAGIIEISRDSPVRLFIFSFDLIFKGFKRLKSFDS